jgi:hypothetical protein
MKIAASMCLLGLAVVVVGLCNDAALPRFDRLLLEHELSEAESHGHPVVLLVEHVGPAQLERLATARSRRRQVTVLSLGDSDARIVPSTVDASIADAGAWTRPARAITRAYLAVGDMRGAAAALVRLYSRELAARGILARLPPRRPLFLPDVAPPVPRPSDAGWMGAGLMLVVVGIGRWIRARLWAMKDSNLQPPD